MTHRQILGVGILVTLSVSLHIRTAHAADFSIADGLEWEHSTSIFVRNDPTESWDQNGWSGSDGLSPVDGENQMPVAGQDNVIFVRVDQSGDYVDAPTPQGARLYLFVGQDCQSLAATTLNVHSVPVDWHQIGETDVMQIHFQVGPTQTDFQDISANLPGPDNFRWYRFVWLAEEVPPQGGASQSRCLLAWLETDPAVDTTYGGSVPDDDNFAQRDILVEASASCGNGALEVGEVCDDGNLVAGDGCDGCLNDLGYYCTEEPSVCVTDCGDGLLAGGEVCDDGNTDDGDGCAGDCLSDESCGNGVLDAGEVCDDGNTDDGDGCAGDCLSDESCGNGVLDAGEVCDDGNTDDGDGCAGDCLSDESCGNGVLDVGESCDDGNTEDGDECSATCTFTPSDADAGCTCNGSRLPFGSLSLFALLFVPLLRRNCPSRR
jgi:cysteine-rich repeat protein